MTIRKAVRADIPQILRLLVQVNMVHHIGRPDLFKGPTTKYDEAQLGNMLEDETRPVFVCAEEETVCGYVFCALHKTEDSPLLHGHTSLYVDDLCVDEAARGRGIGRALMAHVAAFAKAAGCYSVTLNVWACNEGARRFYESLGMHEQRRTMEWLLSSENNQEVQ